MLEGVYFTVSYVPVIFIRSLRISIEIASVEGLILFVLGICNAFQKTIVTKLVERVYLDLSYIYLDWYNRKWPKYILVSSNYKYLCIQGIKSIQGSKPAEKLWYDLLKSIYVTVKMIRISCDHDLFSWVYKT